MDYDQCRFCQEQLRKKLKATIEERDTENLKRKEKEREIDEKFKYFSDKICEIMIISNDIFEEYKSSEFLKNLKNSDEIVKVMKKYIANLEKNELISLLEKINDFHFDEEIELVIQSETIKNLELFLEEYKNDKKSKALEMIGQIKSNFENNFRNQKFHMDEYVQKISGAMEEFRFEEEHIIKIKDLVIQIMKQKLIELINKELRYF